MRRGPRRGRRRTLKAVRGGEKAPFPTADDTKEREVEEEKGENEEGGGNARSNFRAGGRARESILFRWITRCGLFGGALEEQ